jgi:PAS domain S-box-containing protein
MNCLKDLGINHSFLTGSQNPVVTAEMIMSELKAHHIESISSLIQLPDLIDPEFKIFMKIFPIFMSLATNVDPNIGFQFTPNLVSIMIKYGITQESSYLFALMGIIFCLPQVKRYDEGFQFSELAYNLTKRYPNNSSAPYVYFMFLICLPYKKSVRMFRPYIDTGIQLGIDTGNFLMASHLGHQSVSNLLFSGDPLDEALKECNKRLSFSKQCKELYSIEVLSFQQSYIRCLMDSDHSLRSLDHSEFTKKEFEDRILNQNMPALNSEYYILRAQNCFFANDYQGAVSFRDTIEKTIASIASKMEYLEYIYYMTLSMCLSFDELPETEKAKSLRAIENHHRELKILSESCPENFLNRYLLVSAEVSRIQKNHEQAMRFYEQAIQEAKNQGFIYNEAISYEIASIYYSRRQFKLISSTYMKHARTCYAAWGANGKVNQIDRHYPHLFESIDWKPATLDVFTPEQLNFLSILKASQAISTEIAIDRVIRKLFQVCLELSNAQQGSLILSRGGSMFIQAQAENRDGKLEIQIFDTKPIFPDMLPFSILKYVSETGDVVLIDDAFQSPRFRSDRYFTDHATKSILCLPIVRQGERVGLIYLENNLITGAFKEQNLETLRPVVAQAAISIENSNLYSKLEEYKNKIQAILDNTTAIIYVKDTRFRYTLVNQRFETLLALDREDILGKQDYDLFDKALAHQMRHNDELVLESNQPIEIEEVIPYNKKEKTYLSTKFPIYDSKASIHSVCSIMTDITERKKEERERVQLLDQTRQALHIRDEFISIASHELRTPLTPLRLQIQIIKRLLKNPVYSNLTESSKLQMMIQIADDQMDRLNRLVEDLLDISRIRSGKFIVRLKHVSLSELINKIIQEFRSEFDKAGYKYEARIAPHIFGQVDEIRIEQVITNLISNAIKFGRKRPIFIELSLNGSTARFSIRDQGIGIPEKDQMRIFERFERAASAMNFGGMGLGLYISQQIIQAHHGTIALKSEPNVGSIFTVEIPLKIS